jgi:hypothetical protein
MDKSNTNRWHGKSAEEVLTTSFHELKGPIYLITDFLNVINETDVPPDQLKSMLQNMLHHASQSKQVVDSVYQYINDQYREK